MRRNRKIPLLVTLNAPKETLLYVPLGTPNEPDRQLTGWVGARWQRASKPIPRPRKQIWKGCQLLRCLREFLVRWEETHACVNSIVHHDIVCLGGESYWKHS